jgi:hypothetical protein
MSDEHKWFYLGSDDVPQGPVDRAALLEMVKLGHARYDALVWRDGFSGWRSFRDVEEELKNPGAEPATAVAVKAATAAPAKAAAATFTKAATAAPEKPGLVTSVKQSLTRSVGKKPSRAQPGRNRAAPKIARAHLVAGSGFAAAAVVLISVLYVYSGPVRVDASPAATTMRQAEYSPVFEEAAEPQPIPVRVQNPFDASEVFEFPAGTSAAEARDAVADLLLKRAMERRGKVLERRGAATERRSRKKSS